MRCDNIVRINTIDIPDVVRIDNPNLPTVLRLEVAGLPGRNGLDGGGSTQFVAAASIGGHKAVVPVQGGVNTASSNNLSHANRIVGITNSSAVAGSLVDVVSSGLMIEPSWSWSLGPVYLGLNGNLTQVVPTTGFVQKLAVAIESTKIVVQIGPATIKTGA